MPENFKGDARMSAGTDMPVLFIEKTKRGICSAGVPCGP